MSKQDTNCLASVPSQKEKLTPQCKAAQDARLDEWFASITRYYQGLQIGLDFFSEIATRTLLVVGEDDKNAPLQTVISAHSAMPNADLAVIAGGSHPVFLENFTAVWSNVEPFLK